MDIATTISLIMIAIAVPLWAYRTICFYRLNYRAKSILRRLIARHESVTLFGTRVFGFLVVLSGVIFSFLYALAYLKTGRLHFHTFKDIFPRRIYSGINNIDSHIDALLYDQIMPIMVLVTAFMLSFSFTVLMTALRDIQMIRRLQRRISKLNEQMPVSSS
ncbi:hypothetical protein [Roseibium algae]|uniref:Uncharacterized protein n=1 Tax=Roseibium algae TaxID=3123038 RepID=A0ABU8TFH2_9HYPH